MNPKPVYPWQVPGMEDSNLRIFTFFSANLQALLPKIPLKEHATLFQECLLYKALATDDERNVSLLYKDLISRQVSINIEEPGILVSFHTGPYRLLPLYLMKKQVPFTLVVSQDVAEQQTASNRALQERLAGSGKAQLFDILVAEDRLVLLKMRRAIENGRHLLLYLDGNVGAAHINSDKFGLLIPFFERNLWVKKGAMELAYLMKCPVYPFFSAFDKEGRAIVIDGSVIKAHGDLDRRGFVRQTLCSLYRLLELFILEYPMQWEGWLYVHADLEQRMNLEDIAYIRHYMPFEVAGSYFLLHKESYASFKIPKALYDKIREMYFDNGWFFIN